MKSAFVFCIFYCTVFSAQISRNNESMLAELALNDSLTIYQCHVEKAAQDLRTAGGQTITGQAIETSITDKFVLIRKKDAWQLRHYSCTFNLLPNRKFSGLKIKERPYWNFNLEKTIEIKESQMRKLIQIELASRPTVEYDFAITKYTRNQIIIKRGKKFKQILPEENNIIISLPGFFQS